MSKLIVIIGITGTQGGSVARHFAQLPNWRIRGITRDPTKPSATALAATGIEIVSADLDDPSSLTTAFKDANAIFAVTDFWQFIPQPSTHERAAAENKAPNEIAMALEIAQGKNILSAAANHLSTLEHFIFSTLSDTPKWSSGQFTKNLHFDGKAAITTHLQTNHPALAAKTKYLQMGNYLSNWNMHPRFAPQKQPDGTFRIVSSSKPNGKPIPYVNPPNDTGHFVQALIENAVPGTVLLGFCEMLTIEAYAALWGEVNGVECSFAPLTEEQIQKEVEAGQPEWLLREVQDSEAYVTTFGWDGGEPGVLHPKDVGVDLGRLTKAREYIGKEDYSSIM